MTALTEAYRMRAFRILQFAVCGAAAVLLAVLSTDIPWGRWPEILFFTALAVLAFTAGDELLRRALKRRLAVQHATGRS